MLLIDTSSWIHLLRPDGDPHVRARVEDALQVGEACWCQIIQLELWNGAGGTREKKVIRDFARVLPVLPVTEEVWQSSYEIARRARSNGITVPATDIIIAACANYHNSGLESADNDFELLKQIGIEMM